MWVLSARLLNGDPILLYHCFTEAEVTEARGLAGEDADMEECLPWHDNGRIIDVRGENGATINGWAEGAAA